MKRKTILSILIAVFIVIIGFGVMRLLLSFGEVSMERTPQGVLRTVKAKVVRPRDIPTTIYTHGRLRSRQPVVLTSEVTGKLEEGRVPFLPGQTFRKGELLFKIDDRQIVLDINSAKSDFLNALASVLPEIKIDFPEEYEKYQDYFNNCTFDCPLESFPETNNARVKLFLSRFNVYKLYYTVRNLEILRQKHFFYAPFDGAITQTEIRVGSNARAGARLGEIINLEQMEVQAPVQVRDINWIDRNQPVRLMSQELSKRFQGTIRRMGSNIDQQTQTISVFISVDNIGKSSLYDGIFLDAEVAGRTVPSAVVIPQSAVYQDSYVYVIKNGKLEQRNVQVAHKERQSVIINQGLAENDTVAVEVLNGIAGGMKARPRLIGDEGEAAL